MSSRSFTVIIEQDEDGFFGQCPALQGCHAQGSSFEETVENLKDAIRLHVEDRLAMGEPIPNAGFLTLTTLEVSA